MNEHLARFFHVFGSAAYTDYPVHVHRKEQSSFGHIAQHEAITRK